MKEYDCLIDAFSNFLCFHHSDRLSSPYAKHAKVVHDGIVKGADALANSPDEFFKAVSQIWDSLCPKTNSIDDILYLSKAALDMDAHIAACLVNITFQGIDRHLAAVIERQKRYKKGIETAASLLVDAPKEATKGAASSGGAVGASGAIDTLSGLIVSGLSEEIASLKVSGNFTEMKSFYAALQSSTAENAIGGRFCPGQKVLTTNGMKALAPESSRGPVRSADMSSNEGDPSSLRVRLQNEVHYENSADGEKMLQMIGEKRTDFGKLTRKMLLATNEHIRKNSQNL